MRPRSSRRPPDRGADAAGPGAGTPDPAADPWLPLLDRPGASAPRAPAGPVVRVADAESAWATVRADAAARTVAGLSSVTGEPARVLATVRRGTDVGVVVASPVAAPPGWTTVPGGLRVPASVPTTALVAGVPDELASADPAVLELATTDGGTVTVHLGTVARLDVSGRAATPPAVTSLLAAVLAAPLALTVDVVTVGVPVAWPPAVAAAGGRWYALDRADELVPALDALAGGEDPVVVVGPAAVLDDEACAVPARHGVGVVRLDAPPTGTGWRLTDVAGTIRLLPLGVDVIV